jgi:hypothetical protein
MSELYRTRHWIVTEDTERGILRITRSREPFDAIDELERESLGLRELLGPARARCTGVLVDLREGPLRNDPAFEAVMGKLRPELFRGFARSAVLVRSAVGKLQVTRHAREDHAENFVAFHDEPDALAHLTAR